ncbi:uncharacterized protein LOC142318877 isoform X2 [Lycorma delicatula]|uniref:uncharacterized protein LOC142318877 isoform X2 n=1 Tax=Lycorma delicatula TaxID=130591 RepID=UPI003F519754
MEEENVQQKSNLPDFETYKGRLEQQEATKLKAEQIVSTLSRIKAREKASRRRFSTRDESTMIISSGDKKLPSANSAVKEKSNLLKRKLEEDRAKLESQRGSENFNKVSEVVETIRAQIEDRDKLMQQLLLNAQPHEIKEDDDSTSELIKETNPTEPKLPVEVKQKIAELEAKVIDLQENLKEKDNVISARTQAITLLSEDMAKKSKATLDTLEETQEQMRQMQNNFISIEDRMKKEQIRLKEEAEDRKQRCLQAEKNLRIVEAARFDLSTRVAELQEKVVVLQTKNIELEKTLTESETRHNETKDALEAAKSTTVKLKAQFKIKMKALEEEHDLLKKMEDNGSAVTSLQERIAELEEEKEQCHLFKERVVELEEKLSQQGDDLDSHVKAISKLELEKLDLIQAIQEHNCLLSEKESVINHLQQLLTETEQLKVSAEMRAIEVEEKLDAAIKEKITTDSENQIIIDNMKQKLTEQVEIIKELETKLLTRQNEMSLTGGSAVNDVNDWNSDIEEWKRKYLDMELRYNEVNNSYKYLENRVEMAEKQNEQVVIECDKLRKTVSHLQIIVSQCSSQDHTNFEITACSKQESAFVTPSVNEKDIEINKLKEELSATTCELHKLSFALDNLNSTGQQFDELNKQIMLKDKAITDISEELEKRTRKLAEYKKFHKLKCEDVLRVSSELESVTISSQEKIAELEKEIADAHLKELELQKQIKELKDNQSSVPNEQTQKMKKLAASVKLKTKACKDLEARIEEMKKILEEKENSIQELVKKENNNISEISQLNCQLHELQSLPVTKVNEQDQAAISIKLETLLVEKDNLNTQIIEQQNIIHQLESDVIALRGEKESIIIQFEKIQENEFSKNEEILKILEVQVTESRKEIQNLQEQLTDVASKYEQAWAKLQEKEGYIESIESELSKAQERMRSIESNTNEMSQSLRERAEVLGDRLKKAEETNVQLEKYKNDVEMSLTALQEKEQVLQNNLVHKTAENEDLKQMVAELSRQNEQLEREAVDMKNYVANLRNEVINLYNIQDAHNHALEEIERLHNEIKQIKLDSEKTIVELKEREKVTAESTDIELKNLIEKCNTVEHERKQLFRELEIVNGENKLLKEEIYKQKSNFEMRYEFLDSERNHYEELYSKLKTETAEKEEKLGALSESKSKEVESIMTEQRLLVERLHAEFKQKEEAYLGKINEQDEFIKKLQGSLQTIESNTEPLKCELNKVGIELASSKEELMALRLDQEKSLYLKNELDRVRDEYNRELEKERELIKTLQVELLRENAKKEIDSVVTEAENKVDLMAKVEKNETSRPLFKFTEVKSEANDLNPFDNIIHSSVSQENENVDIEQLKSNLSFAQHENERLQAIINKFENSTQQIEAEIISNLETTGFNVTGCIKTKDEEDGWGWGSDEVLMEQETATVLQTVGLKQETSSQQVEIKILQLEQKLSEAIAENVRLTEELKGSQVRCSKLMKKAKELKAKSEDLERGTREKSVGFEDLDFAMQEELRAQIQKLEKSLQEALNENKMWKAEKENFLRKIDTLTNGNERLVDMKERQDIELSIFQKQNSDLKQQILGFEWKIEELMEDNEKLTSNCTEMEEKVNSLAAENENLIKIVGEMKDQNRGNEPQIAIQGQNQNPMFTLFKEDTNFERKIKDSDYNSLLRNFEQLSSEKNELITVNKELKDTVNLLNLKMSELGLENNDLKSKIETSQSSQSDAEKQEYLQLMDENEQLRCASKINEKKLHDLKNKLEELKSKNQVLEDSLSTLKQSEDSLKTYVVSLEDQNHAIKEGMEKKCNNLLMEFNKVNYELQEIIKEKDILSKKLKDVESSKIVLKEAVHEPSNVTELFRGFAGDGPAVDPFISPKENVETDKSDLLQFKGWDNANNELSDETKSENINASISELKKQVATLTRLLQEKETELEISNQSLDSVKLQRENLQEVWSKKYEDLKLEQSSANDDRLEVYEELLNEAEKKYKDNLILKDEEIAHLMCELSSKEKQLVSAKEEITNLTNTELALKEIIENYKKKNELLQHELAELHEECKKLKEKCKELSEVKEGCVSKLNDAETKLENLKIQYDECLQKLKGESEIKLELEQDCYAYFKCLDEKAKQLEEANIKISELNEAKISTLSDPVTDAIVEDPGEFQRLEKQQQLGLEMPTAQTSIDSTRNVTDINIMEEQIKRYKETIRRRDIEIERLMQTLGESEERLIKAEENRLNFEEVNGLKLRLDEALYTVHLRDLRCEELTLELMQLLEERDTLQLRLSTAIRLNEELRRKMSVNGAREQIPNINDSSSCTTRTSDNEHNLSSSDQETTQSDTETGRLDRLHEKLGELHNTGYQKDLSLHQDRIKRHNEQMHLYDVTSSSSSQPASPHTNNEDHNSSGSFLSWLLGSSGSSSTSQVDV